MKYRSFAAFLAGLFMCGCSNVVDYQGSTVSSEAALQNSSPAEKSTNPNNSFAQDFETLESESLSGLSDSTDDSIITDDDTTYDLDYEIDFDLMPLFYGVWNTVSDCSDEFIVGMNNDFVGADFINSRGNICGLYSDGASSYLICENYMSEYYKLIINNDTPDTAYYIDCFEESNSADYQPQILHKTDAAEPYPIIGEINGFTNSVLQHICGYFSPYPYVEIENNGHYYRNEYQYFEGNNSLYILNSYSQNRLSFTSNFVEVTSNNLSTVGDEIYTITYELNKNDDGEWVLRDFWFIEPTNELSEEIQRVSLTGPKSLSESYIESLRQLKEISVLLTEDCDISFLGTLNNLEQLTIDNGESLAGDFPQRSSYASSYDFLQTMNGLSTLSVSNVKDFPIELCCVNPSIKKMWFYACSFDTSSKMSNSVKELKLLSCDFDMNNIISSFPELSSLEIRGGTDDLSMIGDLTELTEHILEMPDINGIEAISECGKLRSLVILARQGDKAAELSDVDFISSLKKLNSLTVYAGTLSDNQKQFINANLPECIVVEYDTP